MTAARDVYKEVVDEVSGIVNRLAGIQLNDAQYHMVMSRLRSRMLRLGIQTPGDYMAYLRSNLNSESQALVSLMTTHHTFFFREMVHFEYLEKSYLSQLIEIARSRPDKKIRIWSAACSRGQEVFTLAMFFTHHLSLMAPDVSFEIFASDVDPESVKVGENGVYHKTELNKVALPYLANHWAKGRDDIADFVKAKDKWDVVNLLQMSDKVSSQKFDIVFCRNVFIYFNPDQIRQCVEGFLKVLNPLGRIFIGVSESLTSIPLKLESYGYSIYGHGGSSVVAGAPAKSAAKAATPIVAPRAVPDKIRVVCVDDSDSILVLLKRILGPESGFEVVGTAANGKIAKDVIASLRPDVVTLDIHMPEMDGVSYMESSFGAGHPPVVMISSVPREEADLALRALKAGASDYVEKPTLNNLAEQADEIRSKLHMAVAVKQRAGQISQLDQVFAKHVKLASPDGNARVIVASMSHVKDINVILSQLQDDQCPTYVMIDGSANLLDPIGKELRCGKYTNCGVVSAAGAVKNNAVGILHFKASIDGVRKDLSGKKVVVCVLGIPSKVVVDKLIEWGGAGLFLEDMDGKKNKNYENLREIASDVMPVASMGYMTTKFLNGE
jgi:chemotaxis protein methyltransferase CheR